MNGKMNIDFYEIALDHMNILYDHAIKLTPSTEIAEILIQKTFEQAFYNFNSSMHAINYGTWFLDIMEKINQE